jgi:DNA-binding MarR family transcriptional regulator
MATDEGLPATHEHADLWLTRSEFASWLSVVRLITRLPGAIDARLMRDAGLSMVEYMALAKLAEAPRWTVRMSDLAELTSSSLSRLSHMVKRLESRDYVRREADPTDGRFTHAILLPAGLLTLESAAPAHVANGRRGFHGIPQHHRHLQGALDLLTTDRRLAGPSVMKPEPDR